MARATFDGPVLVGDNRFGPLRNVGYSELVQGVSMVLTNTTPNTAGYGGASTQFVSNVNIPNTQATIYTPGTTTYAVATVPTACLLATPRLWLVPCLTPSKLRVLPF